LLDDTNGEIARIKDFNARNASEGTILRRDLDKQQAEIYELRKEIDYQAARNADVAAQIRELEFRIKDKDDQLYSLRKDADA
jgi:septal ring factor EnvC (AmiA/AmiB activator)